MEISTTCLQTTVIGSYPKPDYIKLLPDWFRDESVGRNIRNYNEIIAAEKGINELLDRAECEVLKEQADLGINIITDGEVRRENYIYYLLRHVKGFDFQNLSKKLMRGNSYHMVPTVIGPIDIDSSQASKLASEWRKCHDFSDVPVKYTMPGPMTIVDSTYNNFYPDEEKLGEDLAKVLKKVIHQLILSGCKHIQIDEPLFARKPSQALEYGIKHASSCFQDVGSDVVKFLHICCGYPDHFEHKNFAKADRSSYQTLAKHLDDAGFDAVSIEDAHCYNDLSFLKLFTKSSVILGCIAIAEGRIESVEEIQSRIQEALKYIPLERLQVAPDCGLGFLPHDILIKKVTNMVTAAKSFKIL